MYQPGIRIHEHLQLACLTSFIFSATFGAFSLGTVISWPSNALQNGTGYAPDDLDFEFDSNVASWIVSLFMIGAAVVPWVGCKYARDLHLRRIYKDIHYGEVTFG